MVDSSSPSLQRHFGLLQATALNVTMIVGAGVFITIPLMLKELPGPYALLGWLLAGAVMVVDGMIWGEFGATLPGSGGSYLYLLESFGRERWGRLMAFLFIWQFLISGPLELGSGLIAIAQFSSGLSENFKAFSEDHTLKGILWESEGLAISFGPARIFAILLGILIVFLLYRRIDILGKLTVTIWIGVLAVIGWILVEGFLHFDSSVAFQPVAPNSEPMQHFASGLGAAMRLAMYSYLGYYSICYIGDEVRNPGKTIPRAVLLSALLVCVLFISLHLAMLGTVSWSSVPTDGPDLDNYSLAAAFMRRIHGDWAVKLVTVLLIWSCFGSAFAGLLSYSRIPYGAARYGHFFSALGEVHAVHRIPHVSLMFVGGLMLFWSLFDLQTVIDALITTRIIEQFICQIVGVILLRRRQPERLRPYKMWLYPLPCGLALAGWLFMYLTARPLFIVLGLTTLLAGALMFCLWSARTGGWPFRTPPWSQNSWKGRDSRKEDDLLHEKEDG
ncbi:MAG TPA: APC family permease [Gemmataceae bacterium]|nr:APC family permease [Gemmataceae bacterium]